MLREQSRASIAAAALLALLALAAMHALPAMGMAVPAGLAAAPHTGITASDAAGADVMTPADTVHPEAASDGHDAGGVPVHGHSLLHLCLAVLVAALTLVLARWLRPRGWTITQPLAAVAQRLRIWFDIGPPRNLVLCVVRC